MSFRLIWCWFIPAYIPPHKQADLLTNPYHRAALVGLALEPYPQFLLSPVELEQGKICFTVDTVRAFRDRISSNDSLFFLMGSDSFLELETWHDYPGLLRFCQLIIINRGATGEKLKDTLTRLRNVLHEDLVQKISFAQNPYLPVSSTEIRSALLNQSNVSNWLDPRVESYILKHKLYSRR